MSSQLSTSGSTGPSVREPRAEETLGLARSLGVLWVLPAVLLCAAYAYFSFLSLAFFSLALSGDEPLPAGGVVLCLGIPMALLVVMVVLGRTATKVVAARLGHSRRLERLPVWVLAALATLVAATAAALVPSVLVAVLAER